MRESLKKFFCLLKTNPVKGALLILPIALLAVWLVVPKEARAIDFEGAVVGVLGWIFSIFIYILGNLLVKFIDLLVWVAQYNDFVNAEAVKVGWTVVRDVANMFFIVGLLVISFGTVFRIQEYRYNNLLSRLIIMAVLINFSKTRETVIVLSVIIQAARILNLKNALVKNSVFRIKWSCQWKVNRKAVRGLKIFNKILRAAGPGA